MKILKNNITSRLLQIIVTLIGISFISFLLMYISPTDPVRAMFAVSGTIPTEDVLQQMREELGLNRPFFVQYGDWLLSCLKGDFGVSYSNGQRVSTLLASRLLPTLQLALLSLFIMTIMAVPLGVLSALHKDKLIDNVMRSISFVAISMPNFLVGVLLLYFIALKLNLVDVVSSSMGLDKMFLPAFTLGFAMAGKYSRQVRSVVLEELNQDYVVGAMARGLSERTILWKHVIPNAMLPLITLLGLSLGSLLGGTAVVEIIFSFPALGSLAISAITSMDYPLIQGYVLWIALIYMLVNLLVDISYKKLDPRL